MMPHTDDLMGFTGLAMTAGASMTQRSKRMKIEPAHEDRTAIGK